MLSSRLIQLMLRTVVRTELMLLVTTRLGLLSSAITVYDRVARSTFLNADTSSSLSGSLPLLLRSTLRSLSVPQPIFVRNENYRPSGSRRDVSRLFRVPIISDNHV